MEITQQPLLGRKKRDRRYRIAVSIALIVAMTFISFSSSLDNGFTDWDDDKFVTENPLIKDISWENTKEIFTSFYMDDYHPVLVLLSYALEYHFFKLEPFIYHLDNLVLHIFNSLLVFCLVFMFSNKVSISFIAAILFGVHPLNVEPVAWISERKGVLYAFFFLQAIIYYLLYKEKKKGVYYYLSLFVFILSLLSKLVAVTLPFVLLLCDYLYHKNFDKKIFLEKVPFFVISGMFMVDTLFIYKSTGQISSSSLFSPFDNLLIACRNVILYLTNALLPLNLSALYPYPGKISVFMPEFFFPLILLSILAVVVFYSGRYTRKVIFGSLFLLITIMPVIKLVPFNSGGSTMADRYMYIPSIGLFYMAGLAFYRVYAREGGFEKARRISLILFLTVVVLTFSVLTYQRSKVWQDSETLWTDTVKKSSDSSVARYNLANVFKDKGMFEKAVSEYIKALKINPNDIDAYINLGNTYVSMGRLEEAVLEYKKALKIRPNLADTHNNLGVLYRRLGRYEEAMWELRKAVELEPENADIHNNLGLTYSNLGIRGLAVEEFEKALSIDPAHRGAYRNLRRLSQNVR